MSSVMQTFRDLGLIYLDRCRIDEPRVLAYDWSKSPYALANQPEFEQLSMRYGKMLSEGFRPPLEVRHAGQGIGLGLFAACDLKPGDLVGEYAGVIQNASDAPADLLHDGHYLSDYAWNYPDELPDGTEFEITALLEGNELRFANHSSAPNMAVDHTLVEGLFVTFFRVTVDVRCGDQLTVNYGEEYWEGGFRELKVL